MKRVSARNDEGCVWIKSRWGEWGEGARDKDDDGRREKDEDDGRAMVEGDPSYFNPFSLYLFSRHPAGQAVPAAHSASGSAVPPVSLSTGSPAPSSPFPERFSGPMAERLAQRLRLHPLQSAHFYLPLHLFNFIFV